MADIPVPVPDKESEKSPETKKMVVDQARAEIDTSLPFGSVKEAVTHFDGFGSGIPHHLLRFVTHQGNYYDLEKIEKKALELEKDLLAKEEETVGVLSDLEATKRFVHDLKLKLGKQQASEGSPSQSLTLCPSTSTPSPGLILMELNQAKLNLGKTTNDLASIQASVNTLSNKMGKEELLEDNARGTQTQNPTRLDQQLLNGTERGMEVSNFEAEQFQNMADAAKYEVMKAMSEIEQTKNSINMVEMRLIAAKKMEEAARAVEAVAFAEMKVQASNKYSAATLHPKQRGGVTFTFEDYSYLSRKAQKSDDLFKKRSRDAILKKPEEATSKEEVKNCDESFNFVQEKAFLKAKAQCGNQTRVPGHKTVFKFKNSYPSYGRRDPNQVRNEPITVKEKTVPVIRSSISIGDILSSKLILRDDVGVGNHVEGQTERPHQVSLSQMLQEQSGIIFQQPKKSARDGSHHNQSFAHRKKLGFMDISFSLTKHSRKKNPPLNSR